MGDMLKKIDVFLREKSQGNYHPAIKTKQDPLYPLMKNHKDITAFFGMFFNHWLEVIETPEDTARCIESDRALKEAFTRTVFEFESRHGKLVKGYFFHADNTEWIYKKLKPIMVKMLNAKLAIINENVLKADQINNYLGTRAIEHILIALAEKDGIKTARKLMDRFIILNLGLYEVSKYTKKPQSEHFKWNVEKLQKEFPELKIQGDPVFEKSLRSIFDKITAGCSLDILEADMSLGVLILSDYIDGEAGRVDAVMQSRRSNLKEKALKKAAEGNGAGHKLEAFREAVSPQTQFKKRKRKPSKREKRIQRTVDAHKARSERGIDPGKQMPAKTQKIDTPKAETKTLGSRVTKFLTRILRK